MSEREAKRPSGTTKRVEEDFKEINETSDTKRSILDEMEAQIFGLDAVSLTKDIFSCDSGKANKVTSIASANKTDKAVVAKAAKATKTKV